MHGYPHYIANYQAVDDLVAKPDAARGEPGGFWTKIAYSLSVLITELEKPERERLDWIFLFDVDIVVLNPETPLEIFLPQESTFSDIHFLIAENWDGVNSGAYALRVHPWSASFLIAVLAYPIYKPVEAQSNFFREQDAIKWLLQGPDSPLAVKEGNANQHWVIVPMRWFNSMPINNPFEINNNNAWVLAQSMTGTLFDNGTTEVHDDGHGGEVRPWKVMQGDMMVHFAGTTDGGFRDDWLGPWLDRAERRLPEWSNKTTQVQLKEEVHTFWAKVKDAM